MYVLFKKKRGIHIAILVYGIVEHNGKLILSLYIPNGTRWGVGSGSGCFHPEGVWFKQATDRDVSVALRHEDAISSDSFGPSWNWVLCWKPREVSRIFLEKNPLKMVRKQTISIQHGESCLAPYLLRLNRFRAKNFCPINSSFLMVLPQVVSLD